jgi:hypothetical protein
VEITNGAAGGNLVVATLGDSTTFGGLVSLGTVSELGNAPIERSGQLPTQSQFFVLPDSFGSSDSVIGAWRFMPSVDSFQDAFPTDITPFLLERNESTDTWTITGVGRTRRIDAGFGGVQEFSFDLQAGSSTSTGRYFGWYSEGQVPPGSERSTVDYDDGIGTIFELDLSTGDVAGSISNLAGSDATFGNASTLARTYSMQVSFQVSGSADAVRAQFIDVQSLAVSTWGGEDVINIASAPGPDVATLTLGVGDNGDIVELYGASTTTTVDLGSGSDDVTIAVTSNSDLNLTVNGGTGQDSFSLVTVGANTATALNGNDDDDVFLIAGDQLGSGATTTVDGGDPVDQSTSDGDKLIFNPGDPTVDVNPSDGPRSGQIGINDPAFGLVDFSDIEDVVIETGPRIDIANSTPSINEGDDLSISVTLPSVPQNSGVGEVAWSVAGVDLNVDGSLDGSGVNTLTLSWSDLQGLGIDDGDETYPILVSATRTTTGGEEITTTRAIELQVIDVAPTIELDGDATVAVGTPYELNFTAFDDGDDAVVGWMVLWGDGTSNTYGAGVNSATHTFNTPDLYEIEVQVIDDDSSPAIAATTSKQVTASVSPANVSAGSYTINEGELLELAGAVIGTPVSVAWDINVDGSFVDATELDADLGWDDALRSLGIDGSSHDDITISLRATYANGDTATNTGTLSIINVSPTGALATDVPSSGIDEGIASGGLYQVSFESVVEPGSGDTLSYSFDFGNDGNFDVVGSSNANAIIPATWTGGSMLADGLVTILGRVSDQDGGSSDYTTTFRINDVAPTVTLDGAGIATEGASYELSIAFADPGSDGAIRFLIDWGDGSAPEAVTPATQTSPITVDHVFVDNQAGLTTISVIAEDDKGSYPAVNKQITVGNVAPDLQDLAAANASGASIVIEGDTVALTGVIDDPGVLDGFTLTVDWGDGSAPESFNLDSRSTDFKVVHPYTNDGSYTITATLADDDGDSDVETIGVVVDNAAPTVVFSVSPISPTEGQTVNLTGVISDVGAADTHTVEVVWGDGAVSSATVTGRSFTATHVYEDDNPSGTSSDDVTVTVTATDSNDATSSGSSTQTLTVVNEAPVILSAATDAETIAGAVGISETVTVTAVFEDPGATSDTYTATIIWGDGNETTATGTYDLATGRGTVTATHQYSSEAIYDVSISIADDDLGVSDSRETIALVGTFSNTVPVIDDQTFSVAEDATSGAIVGTLAATDDGDVTYELTTLPQLLAMTATSEGPADGKWTEDISLTITINDGTAGTFSSATIEFLLSDGDLTDNTSLSDLVADLNERLTAAGLTSLVATTGTDANGNDIGDKISIGATDDSVLRLQLTGGESLGFAAAQTAAIPNPVQPAEFTIDPDTGVISVDQALFDAETTQSYTLQTTVTDFWGESDTAIITINVTDVNEFAPVLTLPSLIYEIDEFSPNGTVIDTAEASDRDAGDTITFSLDPPIPFAIDPDSGLITVFDSSALDFGIAQQFTIDVIATDDGGLTDTRFIIINLNDLAPQLLSFTRHAPATSSTNADTLVFRATFDADVRNVDSSDFTVDGDTTATVTSVDQVDGSTYDVTVSGGDLATFEGVVGLDLSHSQDITDSSGSALPAGEPAIDETYTRAADGTPEIAAQSFGVDENQTVVGTVTATDPDLPGGTLTFSITGNGADDGNFSITSDGVLSFLAGPDFENPTDIGGTAGDNVYEVEVQVQDAAGETAKAIVTVIVDPLNDNAPVFTSAATIDVAENTTAVQTIAATDDDLPAQTVTYSITGAGADDALFQIVGGNQLEFISAPDFENPTDSDTDNVYEVEVEASDQNGQTATQTVFVTVAKVALAPLTDVDDAVNAVAEGALNGAPIGITARTTSSLGLLLTYHLTDDANGRFGIDPSTGVVSVANGKLLDGPATHDIRIEARDTSGETSAADFTVTVNNVAPVIGFVTSDATLDNRAEPGETVTVVGTFVDPGTPDTFSAVIDWGDGSTSAGSIDPDAGTFTGQHTYGNGGTFTISVTLADDDNDQASAATTATVVGSGVTEERVLQVFGSDAADFIALRVQRDGSIRLLQRTASSGWSTQTYDPGTVDSIDVAAGSGDDLVFVSRSLDLPVILRGEAGDDFLRGGNQTILILGGDGNDLLMGGRGRDVLIGGSGRDLLLGFGGQDLLIGGATENGDDELIQLWDTWNSPGSFEDREVAVRQIVSLVADPSWNFLFGGADRDLFLNVRAGEGEAGSAEADDGNWADLFTAMQDFAGIYLAGSNPVDLHDVDGSGYVSPLDALKIINQLNARGSHSLDDGFEQYSDCSSSSGTDPEACVAVWTGGNVFLDANLDDEITPADLLEVISRLNADAAVRARGEGESLTSIDLIAAATANDSRESRAGMSHNVTALDLVLDEWNSGRSYPEHVDNLRADDGPILSGRGAQLATSGPDAAVFDDGVRGDMKAEKGRDLFFADLADLHGDEDRVRDKKPDERFDLMTGLGTLWPTTSARQ